MNPLFFRSLLFDPAGDANAGGGAGNGAAASDANAGGGSAATPPVTLDVVKSLIAKEVSGSAARLTGEFKSSVGELKSMLQGLVPKADDGQGAAAAQQSQQQQSGNQAKSPEILRLEHTLREQQAKLEATEKRSLETERARQAEAEEARKIKLDAKLSTSLTGIEFLEGMGSDAFNLIRPSLKFNENGEIVAGDAQLPVEQFVKDWLKSRPNYLRSKEVGGAGGAVRGGSVSGGKALDLDHIGPGKMNEQQMNDAFAAVRQLLLNGQG